MPSNPQKSSRRDFLKGLGAGIILGAAVIGSVAYGFPKELKIPGPTTTKTLTKKTTVTETQLITKTETRYSTVTVASPITSVTETSTTITTKTKEIPQEFQKLVEKCLPQAYVFTPVLKDDQVLYYDIYDQENKVIAYGFKTIVEPPKTLTDYLIIIGLVDLNYKIMAIDISSKKGTELWKKEIVEPDFEKEFSGLTVEELKLSSEGGKVDAITGATVSSAAVVEAIREKIQEIISGSQGKG